MSQENGPPIRMTVHSGCVENFEELLQQRYVGEIKYIWARYSRGISKQFLLNTLHVQYVRKILPSRYNIFWSLRVIANIMYIMWTLVQYLLSFLLETTYKDNYKKKTMQIKGSGNIFCTLTFQTEGFVMNKFDSELDDSVVDCLR